MQELYGIGSFLIVVVCWQKIEVTRASTVSFACRFPQVLCSLQRSSLPIQPLLEQNAVWCVPYQLLSVFLYIDPGYGSKRLHELELGLMAGVTGRQGMLTPPRYMIPPLYIQRYVFALFSDLYFPEVLWDWLLFCKIAWVVLGPNWMYCSKSLRRPQVT
jgi:hypothetical protein